MPPTACFSPPHRSFRLGSRYAAFAAAVAAARCPKRRATETGWPVVRHCLLGWGCGGAVAAPLASLLASLWVGHGAMPPRLGLRAWHFRSLVRRVFPGLPRNFAWPAPRRAAPARRSDAGVDAELSDLAALMLPSRADFGPSSRALIRVLASGCLGFGHMWRDMGFASRAELRSLLFLAAPRLARRNVKDMKWKKFLYRELCKSEAGYVCRSPTCDACVAYDDCFGAEV
jgi:nitrogen fixation protein NifQ